MKKVLRVLLVVFLFLLLVFIIPLSINVMYKYDFKITIIQSEWSAGDTLCFYGSLLSFIGTVILGYVSLWQTKKSNSISEKLLKNSLIESTTIPQLKNEFDYEFTENTDTKISIPAHHRVDYGAINLIESHIDNVERYNKYLLNFYFKCSGKGSNIKSIIINDILCVQDPSEDGLRWENNSDNSIPLGLDLALDFDNELYLNWMNSDEFNIQMNVYCEPDGCFDNMMSNMKELCIMFDLTITCFNGVKTRMNYKLWFSKFQGIIVYKTNSTFISND